MSGNLRDTRTAMATATIPGEDTFAFCLVLYLFARPALTRGKRNPCETPWPPGPQDREKATERARYERRRGSTHGPQGGNRRAKYRYTRPRLPDLQPPYSPWPVEFEGGEPLTWGGYDNGLVLYFFIQTSCLWALWIPARGIILHAINTASHYFFTCTSSV